VTPTWLHRVTFSVTHFPADRSGEYLIFSVSQGVTLGSLDASVGSERSAPRRSQAARRNMLRDDTSPVKARIEEMALSTPEVSFKACGNTQEKMHKAENKDIAIVPQAEVVKSGVVRVMELQE
jgi:hypothetical protein